MPLPCTKPLEMQSRRQSQRGADVGSFAFTQVITKQRTRPSERTFLAPAGLRRRGIDASVAGRTRCRLALAAETEQELLEPGQVLLALRRRLGSRVLQVDEGADSLPCCALGERVGQLGLERLLVLPVGDGTPSPQRSVSPAHRDRIERVPDALVLRDGLLLLRVVVLVEVVDRVAGLGNRLLLLARRLLFPLRDVGFLLFAPVSAGRVEVRSLYSAFA